MAAVFAFALVGFAAVFANNLYAAKLVWPKFMERNMVSVIISALATVKRFGSHASSLGSQRSFDLPNVWLRGRL